jgi:hypothetical protein
MPNTDVFSPLEGLGAYVLGGLGAWWVRHRQSQARVLTYEIELVPVLRARPGFDDRIQVKYGDVLVGNLYSCRVLVRNRGNEPLSNQPVRIQLRENVAILEERFETKPALEFGEIALDEESSNEWSRRYMVELINPGDEISLYLTVAGDLALKDIAFAARGGGLRCLAEHSYAARQAIHKRLPYLVIVLLGIGWLVTRNLQASLPSFWAQMINRVLLNGLVPSILGIWSYLRVAPLKAERKRLSYEIVSPRPVYTAHESYLGKVSVEYMGRPVKDLHTCQVVLWNTGNRSLENQNVHVWLTGANILETNVVTEPELEFGSITTHAERSDRRRFHFSQLEPKDKVMIDLVFEGSITSEDVGVAARGEGLAVVSEQGWSKQVFSQVKWSSVVIGGIAFLPLFLFLGCMDALGELGYLLYDWLVDIFRRPGNWTGVLVGAAGLGITTFVVFRVNVWWQDATAPFKSQKASHATGETPAQVVRSSIATLVLGILVFAFVICLGIEILRPGTLLKVLQTLGL